VISNGTSVLRQRIDRPDDVRVLEAIERAAQRGATLTRQLLTFARQQPLKQDVYSVNEVIGSFEAVLRRAVPGSLQFDLLLADKLPQVLVDAPQVEAAILNLIVNARDATPDGGSIVLRTGLVEMAAGQVGALAAGPYVVVAVEDTGEGMSADVAVRAVEPFFTTKPVGKGTGLGLSHVYGLMRQSGGELDIQSIPGKGTTMLLYFPALNDGAEGRSKAEQRDKALVVDDQPEVLGMAIELFQTLGYEVLSANNGPEALAILRRTPDIDVLFSDVVMPGMSGLELGHEARRVLPALKIILASGYASPALKAQGDGEFQLISKPYTMAQILRQLR
jgi:CheY-like chemotaxis protein